MGHKPDRPVAERFYASVSAKEGPMLPGKVGVERAAFVLKNVRAELLKS